MKRYTNQFSHFHGCILAEALIWNCTHANTMMHIYLYTYMHSFFTVSYLITSLSVYAVLEHPLEARFMSPYLCYRGIIKTSIISTWCYPLSEKQHEQLSSRINYKMRLLHAFRKSTKSKA